MSDSEKPINKMQAILRNVGSSQNNDDAANTNGSQLSVLENSEICNAIGDITYYWDLITGDISFSENIQQIAEFIDINKITTTIGFAAVMAPENVNNRYKSVCQSAQRDNGQGVEYSLEYRMANGKNNQNGFWIEDKGKWFAGASGDPETAFGVMRIMTKNHVKEREQAKYGSHDLLTGLVNRRHLREQMKQSVVAIEKHKKQGAFLLIVIDNLAMINQAYGLDIGDEVIALVAKRMASRLRRSDIIGRYAGNKFGVILHNCNEDHIEVAAERLIEAIGEDVIRTGTAAVSVNLLAGGVSIPKHSSVPQDIMQFSEEALAMAKERPSESCVVYEPDNHRETKRKVNVTVASEIVNALNDRRVKVVYQPLVQATSGQIESYECLIRLETKDGEWLPAAQFVPVAERLNLMHLLDLRVLEIALQKLKDAPHVLLGINISAETMADASWFDFLTAAVGSEKNIAERLTIEITEVALARDMAYAGDFVNKIHELGCLVAIDDFGAGNSSFQNLKMLNVDIVKIGGSFIQNLRNCEDDKFFVQTIQNLATHFNVKTVAEWVEHAEDVVTLRDIGVDYLQGFYFAAGKAELHKPDKDGKVILGDIYQVNTHDAKNIRRDHTIKIG